VQLEGTILWRGGAWSHETADYGASETLSLPGLQWCKVHTRDIGVWKFVRHIDRPE
jgi:hypothetical protein